MNYINKIKNFLVITKLKKLKNKLIKLEKNKHFLTEKEKIKHQKLLEEVYTMKKKFKLVKGEMVENDDSDIVESKKNETIDEKKQFEGDKLLMEKQTPEVKSLKDSIDNQTEPYKNIEIAGLNIPNNNQVTKSQIAQQNIAQQQIAQQQEVLKQQALYEEQLREQQIAQQQEALKQQALYEEQLRQQQIAQQNIAQQNIAQQQVQLRKIVLINESGLKVNIEDVPETAIQSELEKYNTIIKNKEVIFLNNVLMTVTAVIVE